MDSLGWLRPHGKLCHYLSDSTCLLTDVLHPLWSSWVISPLSRCKHPLELLVPCGFPPPPPRAAGSSCVACSLGMTSCCLGPLLPASPLSWNVRHPWVAGLCCTLGTLWPTGFAQSCPHSAQLPSLTVALLCCVQGAQARSAPPCLCMRRVVDIFSATWRLPL